MQVLTKDLIGRLPKLYETEDVEPEDKQVIAKFFHPASDWTWYVIEFDGQDLCWGLVSGFETEFGYFSLSEITQPAGPLGLSAERDRWFTPTVVKDLKVYGQGGTVD